MIQYKINIRTKFERSMTSFKNDVIFQKYSSADNTTRIMTSSNHNKNIGEHQHACQICCSDDFSLGVGSKMG